MVENPRSILGAVKMISDCIKSLSQEVTRGKCPWTKHHLLKLGIPGWSVVLVLDRGEVKLSKESHSFVPRGAE